MNLVSMSGLAAFVFMGSLGVAGGAAISHKLINPEATRLVLYYGGGWVCLGSAMLGVLLSNAHRRAILHQLFIGLGVNVGAATILLGISSPFFWLGVKQPVVGMAVSVLISLFLGYQIYRANRNFNDCWQRNHSSVLAVSYNLQRGVIDGDNLLHQLGVHADLLLPTRSQAVASIIKAFLIISMFVGFSVRNVFPQASIVAWAVPALILTTVPVQIGWLRVLLARKIRLLELESNKKIAPMTDVDLSRARNQKKKIKRAKS